MPADPTRWQQGPRHAAALTSLTTGWQDALSELRPGRQEAPAGVSIADERLIAGRGVGHRVNTSRCKRRIQSASPVCQSAGQCQPNSARRILALGRTAFITRGRGRGSQGFTSQYLRRCIRGSRYHHHNGAASFCIPVLFNAFQVRARTGFNRSWSVFNLGRTQRFNVGLSVFPWQTQPRTLRMS